MTQTYIEIPLWLIPIIVAIFAFLFGYIWTSLNGRVKKLEGMEEDTLKKQAAAGIVLTVPTHDIICSRIQEHFEKTLVSKLESMEKNFGLMIENSILKALKNYEVERNQGIQGVQGVQGIQGKRGLKGRR
jgi:citrate lyase gamma subunit